ncbi:hypothetical protein VW29_19620 [Devosia limi DSM 17137]|uniref:Selenocysteine lyase/Cysteine desulfurase n=1 Tax=Devosia limi DSM 17137 TaxID=1121477 RepID=A0A0F5L3Q9_9HYPH|nr:aminotransferase class V-fold PLP-dependent enzyme [Devosia limi]KKB76844.1 hypothetical protein VW29_19620 [Devosia limi DSM 17137]SHF27470.1 Selenocysteine lyase/Cysteine desulfurase [Devosia limi DSM 17137]
MRDVEQTASRLIDQVAAAVVGASHAVAGPFGSRRLVYADYTASGRSLQFIEDAMANRVLPYYANTHTETSYTGMQTTRFREQARRAIRRSVGASEQHAVIFCGSGATAGVNKLASILGLRSNTYAGSDRPVVFVGPYEHHSNDLIWRESCVELVRIPLDETGHLCMGTLAGELLRHRDAPMRIGSFSAASNVTGVRTDMRALAQLLHEHDALFFADYAAAAPYVAIAMSASAPEANDHIDAIFCSPHKFVGGPGASGVLVADRKILASAVPSVPGGGTVAYVNARMHRYVADAERREEAGTPAILGDIRAGMVMQLKADIGAERIEALEAANVARVLDAWADEPNIEILGPSSTDRLAIFSFNIRSGGRYLHPNFVVALLNDLFGIQARGGCSCAGPYAHDLLGINDEKAARYDALIQEGLSAYRPGWVRLNFNFFLDAATVEFIVAAVRFIARRGAEMLAYYGCDPVSGRWRVTGTAIEPAFGFDDLCDWGSSDAAVAVDYPDFATALAEAERLADAAQPCRASADAVTSNPDRWFALAGDAA